MVSSALHSLSREEIKSSGGRVSPLNCDWIKLQFLNLDLVKSQCSSGVITPLKFGKIPILAAIHLPVAGNSLSQSASFTPSIIIIRFHPVFCRLLIQALCFGSSQPFASAERGVTKTKVESARSSSLNSSVLFWKSLLAFSWGSFPVPISQ